MAIEAKYLVIGGGPTGLGSAIRLQESLEEWHLLEREGYFGGLASSFIDEQGFTWDLGGHVQFSHYDTFDRYMNRALGSDGWLTHKRESWVWIRQRFVPYPIQNNLHRLDPKERWTCVKGFLMAQQQRASATEQAHNFRDWILHTFGDGIAKIFLEPYNFKVWAYPLEELDWRWIGERVAVPSLESIIRSICTERDEKSWGPNNVFRFPKYRGTGAIWNAIGSLLPSERVSLQADVIHLDAQKKIARTSDGREYRYEYLISSMPLNLLIGFTECADVPGRGDALKFSSTHIVGLGIEGQSPDSIARKCWMYFPENNSPYYRVTVFSNYSPYNVPDPGKQWSLMTETSESSRKEVNAETLVDDTVRALKVDGLLRDSDKIVSVVHRRLPLGYPTPFIGRDEIVNHLLRRFEQANIYSRGRFGAWKYEVSNQDHSFAQGYECAERLIRSGGPEMELTLWQPSLVNSRRNP